jgi:exodeoxyribonuclease-5
MPLSLDQQVAADKFMTFLQDDSKPEMIIEGHSGSGKSYLTKHLIGLVRAKAKLIKILSGGTDEVEVICTATTNKAAEVLSKATGEPAQTIHSLLGLQVKENHSTGKVYLKKTRHYQVVSKTLIIIDEASMVDTNLLNMIRESTMNCKVLYVGDPYQLPPVKESFCPVFLEVQERATLTTIQRQAANNPIIAFGDLLRKAVDTGVLPRMESIGSTIHKLQGPAFQEAVEDHFTRDSKEEYKMLTWTNRKSQDYNTHIRKLFTNSPFLEVGEHVITNKPILDGKRVAFKTDEMARVTNTYPSILHGLQGMTVELDNLHPTFLPNSQADVKAQLKMLYKEQAYTEYFHRKQQFADLRPVHASTVHKSQGSTYEKVFINLTDIGKNNKPHEVARLLYVAITRASDSVYLYGDLPPKYRS